MDWLGVVGAFSGLIGAITGALALWRSARDSRERREREDDIRREVGRLRAATEQLESRDAERHEAERVPRVTVRVGMSPPIKGPLFEFKVRNHSLAHLSIEQFRMQNAAGTLLSKWCIDFPQPVELDPGGTATVLSKTPSTDLRDSDALVKLASSELRLVDLELEEDVKTWLAKH